MGFVAIAVFFFFLDYNKQQRAEQPNNKPKNSPSIRVSKN
jgi:hypothetical protein